MKKVLLVGFKEMPKMKGVKFCYYPKEKFSDISLHERTALIEQINNEASCILVNLQDYELDVYDMFFFQMAYNMSTPVFVLGQPKDKIFQDIKAIQFNTERDLRIHLLNFLKVK